MTAKADVFIAAKDKVQVETFRQLFRGMGVWGVAGATDAEKAQQTLRAAAPTTILICQGLAGTESAPDFVQALRRDKEVLSRKAHMLFVGPREDHAAALRNGAHACIGWPISLADLMRALASLKSDTRPFVEHSVYVGPCRRTKASAGRGVPQRRESDKSGLTAQLNALFAEQRDRLAKAATAAKTDQAAGATLFEANLGLQRTAKELGDKTLEDATAALAEALSRRAPITAKAAAMIEEYAVALGHLHKAPDTDERLMLGVLVVSLGVRIGKLLKQGEASDGSQPASKAAALGAK